ncbi:MAG: NUDIX hydrolase, partial [Ignavibacteriales bacterium]|nr:NUDIX hydrolase [Ignavibacteriales bacterium]
RRLQIIAKAGIEYAHTDYDVDRYRAIQDMVAEILENYSDIPKKKLLKLFEQEKGYITPKIDVRAAIFKDDKILLVKEKIDGKWSMPGGWADINLSLKESLIKEAKEEAGVEVEPKRVIAVLDRKKHNPPLFFYGVYKIFVQCDLISGEFSKNAETSDADFFLLDKLPPLSVGRNTFEQIKMCFDVKDKENFDTIFE